MISYKKIILYILCVFMVLLICEKIAPVQFTDPSEDIIEEDFNNLPKLADLNLKWEKIWDFGEYDSGHSIVVDSQGAIYAAGDCEAEKGDFDGLLVKYDASGALLWSRLWNGSRADSWFGVVVDSLDNVFVAGWTLNNSLDICLVKYDGNGHQLWNRTWGSLGLERGWLMAIDLEDNIYITGVYNETNIFLMHDHFRVGSLLVVKYSSSGEFKWAQIFPGKLSMMVGMDIEADRNGDIYIFGMNYTKDPNSGMYVGNYVHLKLNSSGVLLWKKTQGEIMGIYGTINSNNEIYVASGRDPNENGKLGIHRYDGKGELIWEKKIEGSSTTNYSILDITVDSQERIFITGANSSQEDYGDVFVMVYDAITDQALFVYWGGAGHDRSYSITVSPCEETIYITGESKGHGFALKYQFDAKTPMESGGGGGDSSSSHSTNNHNETIPGYSLIFLLSTMVAGIYLTLRKQKKLQK